jgi:hypothetical protein
LHPHAALIPFRCGESSTVVGLDYKLDDRERAEDFCKNVSQLVKDGAWVEAAKRELFKKGILVEVRPATAIFPKCTIHVCMPVPVPDQW